MPKEKDTTTEAEAPAPRSFTVWLAKLADGEADSNLAYELQQLMQRLDEEAHTRNGRVKGKINLKLNFSVDETGIVGVGYEIDVKAPPRKTSPAVYWLDRQSNLVEKNPRQQDLPLRDVGGGKREFRNVDAPAGGAPREV